MRRLDFPARWVRARFEPLPESQGARVGRGLAARGPLVLGGGGPSGRPPAALSPRHRRGAVWRGVAPAPPLGSWGVLGVLWVLGAALWVGLRLSLRPPLISRHATRVEAGKGVQTNGRLIADSRTWSRTHAPAPTGLHNSKKSPAMPARARERSVHNTRILSLAPGALTGTRRCFHLRP